jgi:maleamate amidohydrolase
MSDIYKEIGFDANPVGYGEKPGIAVVDFQKGFTEARFPLGGRPLVERALTNTMRLLAAARKIHAPVASCYTAYSGVRDAPRWKIPTVVNDFHHGSECTELDERIYDPEYDTLICKSGPSIFFNTSAVQLFVKERVDTIIVAGCNTSGCIRASVIDAFSFGFRVIVPEPCVGDADEGPHRDNLRDVGRRYADIVTLDSVLDYLESVGRRNA